MATVNPSAQQLAELQGRDPGTGPIVMLNLLRYHAQARYPADSDASPCTGREAYARYGAVAMRKVAQVGGRAFWMGAVQASVIAPQGEEWDDVVLIEYPSIKAFLGMIAMPDYLESSVHRTAALADARLILTEGRALPGS